MGKLYWLSPEHHKNMNIALIGIWLIIFGVLSLVSTEIPKWIVPLAAIIVGLIVVAGGWWKRSP